MHVCMYNYSFIHVENIAVKEAAIYKCTMRNKNGRVFIQNDIEFVVKGERPTQKVFVGHLRTEDFV